MNQYRRNFDHLGQLRAGDYAPWTRAEKTIVILFVAVVIGLLNGNL